MKRSVGIVLAAVAATIAAGALAACSAPKGQSGGEQQKNDYTFSYSMDVNGAYTVTGIDAFHFGLDQEDGKDVTKYEIPSTYLGKPVTAIADSAFANNTYITELSIPDSIAYIGSNAFSGCTNLRTLDMGNGVVNIGENAFFNCFDLALTRYWGSVAEWCGVNFENVYSNPASIADDFFIDGSRAVSVNIPSGVKAVKPYAFYYCASIRSVTLSRETKSVGSGAFGACFNLTDIKLGGVETIGEAAFAGTRPYSITLPETLKEVSGDSFYNARIYEVYNLATADIAKLVTAQTVMREKIKTKAQGEPTGVEVIGDFTFYNSTADDRSLIGVATDKAVITLPTTEKPYEIESRLFEYNTNIVKVAFSPSVTAIGSYAFNGCTRLTEITINKELVWSDYRAFAGCTHLQTVNYTGTQDEWDDIFFDEESTSDPLWNGAALYVNKSTDKQ